ncbi:hypothetical protein [Cupriavidus pauculus]|uniref:hypothetical protein n=1 Tax=Cupriavidus pauculus TaxID=82633 RepID=UPI001EE35F94|nr:hypothetical protein [Cupriavidus pauculus]GJG96610.1 hypothetical protein CBA19C6_18995 [Cupriavidus pauculus]
MHRIGRLAFFLVLALWIADVAWASDIACPQAFRGRCDVSAPATASCAESPRLRPHGRQLICEYAMLHESYEDIYADQQRRRNAGTLRKSDLDAWRKRRDACTSVRCLDQLFASWRSVPHSPAVREASTRPPVVADNKASRRAMPPPVATSTATTGNLFGTPSGDPDPVVPIFEPVQRSLRDSLQPLPPMPPRPTRAGGSPMATSALAWLPWLVGLLAAGGTFYWLVMRKRATRYLDATYASVSAGLAWLKTLPMLVFILTGLALLNGVLLVVLLGGWGVHLPGIN